MKFQSIHFLSLALGAQAITVINHDAVVPLDQRVELSYTGISGLNFQPYISIESGCVPFPAVDAQGDVSGGLQETGAQNGHCSKSRGQVYLRGAWYRGKYALMYSWFFPKDGTIGALGHRYDWENVVIWLDNPAVDHPRIVGMAASAHGGYSKKTSLDGSYFQTPNHVKVRYHSILGLIDHQLDFSPANGGLQPLVQWEAMPAAARSTLQNYNFGKANVPCKDGNFFSNLEKAYI